MFRCFAIASVATALISGCSNATSYRFPSAETKKVQAASGVAECSERYTLLRAPQIDPALPAKQNLETTFGAERFTGVEENVTVMPADGTTGGFLRVRYPKDSINFASSKNGHPLGGASFYVPYFQGRAACLHYQVRFQENFAFRKGGKLPWSL